MEIRFIELFAGIGGFRYGLEKANDTITKRTQQRFQQRSRSNTTIDKQCLGTQQFYCVWANEIDRYACQVYRKNFGGKELIEEDITKIRAEEIPYFDLLTAGFPCQAFSIAGKRKGFEDTRGTLFFEIAQICKAKRPRYILLENVKGLLSHDSGQTFQTILKVLSEIGYDLQWQVLNSKNFGVPQNRERVFIVGHFRGASRPEVFPIIQSSKGHLKYSAGVISNREKWLKGEKHLSREFSQGQRIYSSRGISQTLAGNAGGQGGKTGLYQIYDGYNKNYRDDFGAIRTNAGCHTACNLLDNGMKIRRLTPIECERLQGFPDGWTEGISDTQRYKCLGNAVTINVVREIGKRLWTSLQKQSEAK